MVVNVLQKRKRSEVCLQKEIILPKQRKKSETTLKQRLNTFATVVRRIGETIPKEIKESGLFVISVTAIGAVPIVSPVDFITRTISFVIIAIRDIFTGHFSYLLLYF